MGQVKINDPGNIGTFKCQGVKSEAKKTDGSLVHETIDAYIDVLSWRKGTCWDLQRAVFGFRNVRRWHRMLLGLERFSVCMVRYRALFVHLNFGTNLITYCVHTPLETSLHYSKHVCNMHGK